MVVDVAYAKGPALRYLSHLELMRAFERAVRRAGVPVEHSQGFNPRPKITHASALAVGMSSEVERAWLVLSRPMAVAEVQRRLTGACPDGLQIIAVRQALTGTKPPYGQFDRAEYRIELPETQRVGPELEARIAELLARREISIMREKDGQARCVDIRPFVESLQATDCGLRLVLAFGEGGQAKPVEVLAALGLWSPGEPVPWIHRTALFAHRQRSRGSLRRR